MRGLIDYSIIGWWRRGSPYDYNFLHFEGGQAIDEFGRKVFIYDLSGRELSGFVGDALICAKMGHYRVDQNGDVVHGDGITKAIPIKLYPYSQRMEIPLRIWLRIVNDVNVGMKIKIVYLIFSKYSNKNLLVPSDSADISSVRGCVISQQASKTIIVKQLIISLAPIWMKELPAKLISAEINRALKDVKIELKNEIAVFDFETVGNYNEVKENGGK